MMGAGDTEQMRENLAVLDLDPMSDEELTRMRKIGDFVYGKKLPPTG
jgi:aryl-alcohol dehydrogenase-like predicted oxidoreductase